MTLTFSTTPSGHMPRVEEYLPQFQHREESPREAEATQGNHRRATLVFREGEAGMAIDVPNGALLHRAVREEAPTSPARTSQRSVNADILGQGLGKRLAEREGVLIPSDDSCTPPNY